MGETIGEVAKKRPLGVSRPKTKIIIGSVDENPPTAVEEQTIELKPTALKRGGKMGAVIRGRKLGLGDKDAGPTSGMGGRKLSSPRSR